MMNMSDDDATDQFDEQVQELLAQTLEGEDQLEELFEQRTKKKLKVLNVKSLQHVKIQEQLL